MGDIVSEIARPIVKKMAKNYWFVSTLCLLALVVGGAYAVRWLIEAVGYPELARQAGFFYVETIVWWVCCAFALPEIFPRVNWKKVYWIGFAAILIAAAVVDGASFIAGSPLIR